jgi:hypothetical protein
MGKASQNKKVARAARTGGGRTAKRGSRSGLMFPAVIGVVVVLGILLVVMSRSDRGVVTVGVPTLTDHVHDAYGIYICDEFQAPLVDVLQDPLGIHTHGDGLIHIHPTSSNATGRRAIFQHFADDTGLKLTATSIELPNGTKRENGDKCGDEAAELQVAIWDNPNDESPTMYEGDPNEIPLRTTLEDDRVIVLAFVPPGTEIPKPPSVTELEAPSDLVPPTVPVTPTDVSTDTTPPSTPGDTTAPTAPAGGTPTTTP